MTREPANKQQATGGPDDGLFLPDLCSIRMLLFVVIIAELLAFILTLAASEPGQRWQVLGLVSLFVQWIALFGVLMLCLLRPWLRRFTNWQAALISFALLQLLVVAISEIAFNYVPVPGLDTSPLGHADFLFRNLMISIIVSLVMLRYFYIHYENSRAQRAESLSRIEALQARIRPHFLFNSMNVIASLARNNPSLAERAIEDLSRVFRASLAEATRQIALGDEIGICKSYLQIESLRLGDRLRVDWQVDDDCSRLNIPALLLQPLVENAVVHGIEPLPEGGVISIQVEHNDRELVITITNPCEGVACADTSSRGNRIAQENITARLYTLYEGEASFSTERLDDLYRARIVIPLYQLVSDDDGVLP